MMKHLVFSTSGKIPVTWKSSLWSQRSLGSHATSGLSPNGVTRAIGNLKRGGSCGIHTFKELLLASAVNRYGATSWDSVSSELRKRTSSQSIYLTPHHCEQKYTELKRRFNQTESESHLDAVNNSVTIPLLEDLRKLRVLELQRQLQNYDLYISSLQLKVKKLRVLLDEQGLRIAENQENSQKNRRKLAEATRDFKKAPSQDKSNLFNSLLKAYQEEVDNLTKRAKFGENAFLNICQKLYEAPDPYPLIASLPAMQKEDDEGERRFPPQHQDGQPGKEYLMNPRPIYNNNRYKPSSKLKGKVALVTGGDSGIGRSVCYYFAKEGATIAFTYVKGVEDIDANETLKIINESKMEGAGDPIAIPADLRYDKNCKKVVDEVVSRHGCIDILVNNPAVQYYTYSYSLDEITEERLDKVFKTNIFSFFFMSKHALKHMKEGSSIINSTSVLAYVPDPPSWLDYISTKGAIVSFTRGLALHLVKKEIRVNGVAPGPIWTPLQASALNDHDIATLGEQVPMDRAGQPHEIAPSYVFLACKEDSSYMTGQVLHPNGGTIVNG